MAISAPNEMIVAPQSMSSERSTSASGASWPARSSAGTSYLRDAARKANCSPADLLEAIAAKRGLKHRRTLINEAFENGEVSEKARFNLDPNNDASFEKAAADGLITRELAARLTAAPTLDQLYNTLTEECFGPA